MVAPAGLTVLPLSVSVLLGLQVASVSSVSTKFMQKLNVLLKGSCIYKQLLQTVIQKTTVSMEAHVWCYQMEQGHVFVLQDALVPTVR